jgi:Pectate lyase superfamily protein
MSLTKVSYSMVAGAPVNVLDYGADPTGSTDSTNQIQAAINAAATAGEQVTAQGTFKISSKLIIKGNTDFSQAIFNVYSAPAVAVEISTGSAANPTDNLFNYNIWMPLEINNMTKPTTGWAGQGIGVRTVNLNSCRVFFNQIKNFATGLLVTAYSEGNSYNDYHIGALINNQINLQLYGSDVGGYVNENNFYGGRYFFYSAEGTNVSGTRHISIPTALSATGIQNNNVFYKPSVEGDTPQYHIENAGQYNTFIQGRYESAPFKILYVGDTAAKGTYNVILGGYGASAIEFSYSGSASSFLNQLYAGADRSITNGSSTQGVVRLKNVNGNSDPVHTLYGAGVVIESATSSQWSVQHCANFLAGKQTADSFARLKMDYQNGLIAVGNGTVAPTNGATGSFVAGAKTVTVVGGIITSIV